MVPYMYGLSSLVADGPEFKIHLNYKRHTTYKCYCRVSLKDCDEKFVISKDAKVTVDMCKYRFRSNIGAIYHSLIFSMVYCPATRL